MAPNRFYANIELSFESWNIDDAKETLRELLCGYDVDSIDLRSNSTSGSGFKDEGSFTPEELMEI
jgi:hypothetical protein